MCCVIDEKGKLQNSHYFSKAKQTKKKDILSANYNSTTITTRNKRRCEWYIF